MRALFASTAGRTLLLLLSLFVAPAVVLAVALQRTLWDKALLTGATLAVIAFNLALLALIVIGPRLAGTDRERMARLFGPWLRSTFVMLAIATALQTLLLVWALGYVEQRVVPWWMLFAIAVAAFTSCSALAKAGLTLLRDEPGHMPALLADPQRQAPLVEHVSRLATTLGAAAPDQIVLGLEPSFFVTAAPLQIGSERQVQGRTLYLSMPLMRVLERDEFSAIVGHELGHFRGADTEFSTRFSPLYTRLRQAMEGLNKEEYSWVSSLAKRPVMFIVHDCYLRFAGAERTVGRERELLADRAAVEATSADTFARALVKVAACGPIWNQMVHAQLRHLGEGRSFDNMSTVYVSGLEDLGEGVDWVGHRAQWTQFSQPHPVDTHPPLGQRLQAVGVPVEQMAMPVTTPQDAAIGLIDDPEALEVALTETMSRGWVASGLAAAVAKASAQQEAQGATGQVQPVARPS